MSEEKEGGGERKGGGEGEEARVEVERRESEGKRGGRCEEEEEERGRKGNLGMHIQILYATTTAGVFIQMYTLLLYIRIYGNSIVASSLQYSS